MSKGSTLLVYFSGIIIIIFISVFKFGCHHSRVSSALQPSISLSLSLTHYSILSLSNFFQFLAYDLSIDSHKIYTSSVSFFLWLLDLSFTSLSKLQAESVSGSASYLSFSLFVSQGQCFFNSTLQLSSFFFFFLNLIYQKEIWAWICGLTCTFLLQLLLICEI